MRDKVLGTLEKKWIRKGCFTLQRSVHSWWNCLAYWHARHDQYNHDYIAVLYIFVHKTPWGQWAISIRDSQLTIHTQFLLHLYEQAFILLEVPMSLKHCSLCLLCRSNWSRYMSTNLSGTSEKILSETVFLGHSFCP